jgi:predicted phosphodiesterase
MKSCVAFALFALASGLAPAQLLTPAWVELGEDGQALARVIVQTETCPAITVDGVDQTMSLRRPVPAGFQPLCEFTLPRAAKTASVNTPNGGQTLHLPTPDPISVVVIGDTGCRIKGDRVQDCNDMTKWPEQAVADSAASVKPDLIIHVGDYLYRESVCPVDAQKRCGGTPVGDNWDAWNADFFAPAAELLAAAPWAFARGNHEDCGRAWRGWFYYLDPRPWTNVCWVYTPPYVVRLGARELVMLDSSAAKENDLDPKQVGEFTEELRSIHADHAWLVDHHPFWGVTPSETGKGVKPLSAPLEAAWEQASPTGIDIVLSGHTHFFAVFPFGPGRPMQIVSGDGGTELSAPIPGSIDGTVIEGAAVRGSATRLEFGYAWLQKTEMGWNLSLRSTTASVIVQCELSNGQAACGNPAGK